MSQQPFATLRSLLPTWKAGSIELLDRELANAHAPGMVAPEAVGELRRLECLEDDGLLAALLPAASGYAHVPISNFHVGAVVLGSSGAMYCGANLEIPGVPLNQAVHAEQAAIANAFVNEEKGITAIATSSAPCGHCRQFLNEITDGGSIRVVVPNQQPKPLKDLLPEAFGPLHLGVKDRMFGAPAVALRLGGTSDDLIERARKAATRSYAPHTRAYSGCAIQLRNSTVAAGSYLENAAFNPSLSPLQSALVGVALRRAPFDQITRVVLVELQGAAISQRAGTEMVLRGFGLKAGLEVVLAAA